MTRNALTEWITLGCSKSTMGRGLKYAVVVGSVLIAINHGDALLHGDVTGRRLLQMGLTVVVPYWVSVLSSVGALREQRRRASPGGSPGPRAA